MISFGKCLTRGCIVYRKKVVHELEIESWDTQVGYQFWDMFKLIFVCLNPKIVVHELDIESWGAQVGYQF